MRYEGRGFGGDRGALNRLLSAKLAEISWPPTNVGKDWTYTMTTSTIPIPWRCSCPASFAAVAVAVAVVAAADASELRRTASVAPYHNLPVTAGPWASRQNAVARNLRRSSANRYCRCWQNAIVVVRNPRLQYCRCSGDNRLRWTAAVFGNRHRHLGDCCCTVAAGRNSWTRRRRFGRHGGVAAPATPDVAVVAAGHPHHRRPQFVAAAWQPAA